MPTLKARKRRVRRRSAKKRVRKTKGKKKRSRRRLYKGGLGLGCVRNCVEKDKWRYCIKKKVEGKPGAQNHDCAGLWSGKLQPPSMLSDDEKKKYKDAAIEECLAYAPTKEQWDNAADKDGLFGKRAAALLANGTNGTRKCIAAKGKGKGVSIFNNPPKEAMFYKKTDETGKIIGDLNDTEKLAKQVEFYNSDAGLLSGAKPTDQKLLELFPPPAEAGGGRRKSRRRRRRRRKKSKQSKKRRRRKR